MEPQRFIHKINTPRGVSSLDVSTIYKSQEFVSHAQCAGRTVLGGVNHGTCYLRIHEASLVVLDTSPNSRQYDWPGANAG
jgi:hypothetical protein